MQARADRLVPLPRGRTWSSRVVRTRSEHNVMKGLPSAMHDLRSIEGEESSIKVSFSQELNFRTKPPIL
jgi:hypothetical protein